jgi:hypothetical protein
MTPFGRFGLGARTLCGWLSPREFLDEWSATGDDLLVVVMKQHVRREISNLNLFEGSHDGRLSIAIRLRMIVLSAGAISRYAVDGNTPVSVVAGSATGNTYNQQFWDSGPISDGQQ